MRMRLSGHHPSSQWSVVSRGIRQLIRFGNEQRWYWKHVFRQGVGAGAYREPNW